MKNNGQLLNGFLNLIFPPLCAVCRARLDTHEQQGLCPLCCKDIVYLQKPLCRICGMELAGEEDRDCLCGECLVTPPAFSLARSLVRYQPTVQKLIQRLKFSGDTSVVGGISVIIRGADLSQFDDCQWIIPVPLHVNRHRNRGLNQATILARLFFPGKAQDIRVDILRRLRNTTPQTMLSGQERRKNLRGAFAIRPHKGLEAARVCLVDDVYTTGTTLRECAKLLASAGVTTVKVLTLARAAVPQRGRIR